MAEASVDVAPPPPSFQLTSHSVPAPLYRYARARTSAAKNHAKTKHRMPPSAPPQRRPWPRSAAVSLASGRARCAIVGRQRKREREREREREWEPSSSLPRRSIRSLITPSARDRSCHVCTHEGKEPSPRCGCALPMRFRYRARLANDESTTKERGKKTQPRSTTTTTTLSTKKQRRPSSTRRHPLTPGTSRRPRCSRRSQRRI